VRVQKITTGEHSGDRIVPGGLWDTTSAESQADELRHKLANLVEALVRNDIPMTFVAFPRSTVDADYMFRKLSPLMPGIGKTTFNRAFFTVAKPDLVQTFNSVKSSGEASAFTNGH
jgi:hypothetical protein